MYLLWIFSDQRNTGKSYQLPMQMNWSGRLDIADVILGDRVTPTLPVTCEAGQWALHLPEGFQWEGEGEGATRPVINESVLRMTSDNYGQLTVIASKYTRENSMMRKYMLPYIDLTIGKAEGSAVRYARPMVSSKHADISVQGAALQFTDHSVNGSWVNGRKVNGRSVMLHPGDVVFIAPALRLVVGTNFFAVNSLEDLTIRADCMPMQVAPPAAGSPMPTDSAVTREYHRAPRLMQQPNTEPIAIEAPLEKDHSRKTPTWLAIGPSITMITPMLVSSLVMGRSMGASLVMMGTSSALAVMWSVLNRRFTEKEGKLNEQNRQNICRQYYAEIEETLQAETDRERKRLNMNYLSVGECVALPHSGDHRMWERLPNHEDFLMIRLGVGEHRLPCEITVPKPRISLVDDPLRHEPQRLKDVYQMMNDTPITIDPRKHRIIGVLGNTSSPWMMQSMVVQIAATHSYRDVRIVLIHDEQNAEQWRFARYLQHVYAADDRTLRMSVCTPTAIHEVLNYFDNVLKVRSEYIQNSENSDGDSVADQLPWYMFFVTDPKLVEDQPILRYLNQPGLGFTMVMQASEMEELPKECDLIIEARTELGTIFHGDGTMTGVSFETVEQSQLQAFAKAIAPYRIKEMTGDTAIPSLVTFLETYGVRRVEDIDVCHNWSENHAWQSIKTILGLRAGSAPFILDISDKNHGPHGLIAGTTGAGKSVLLQSFILSLALNYSPSEVQFILIDYKGGGTSESFRELPHVAGIIDSSEGARTIFRALASIRGEIKRREAIFKNVGVNNIDDYMKLFNADPAEATLGHLIIIVDEFAELKKEEPEFMTELVSAARVGRSLGMHLVLATQKPGNSVSDEIDANTRFRICLRVASRSDSNDMIKHPDAAYLKGMGRCYVRVGSDEVYEQVQTSWSGSPYNPVALRPEEEPRILNDAGQPIKFRKKKKVTTGEQERSELDVVLEYIRECCTRHQYDWAAQMWLKEMPAVMMLDKLCEEFSVPMWDGQKWPAAEDKHFTVLYGMADDVNGQTRLPAQIDFTAQHNIIICGLPGSGKTTALQTIGVALSQQYSPDEINIYAFSLTSHVLNCLTTLPHVGEVVYEEEPDEQMRLMNMLYQESERRKKIFREQATDNYIQYNRSVGDDSARKIPAIVVFIDRMQQLRDWENDKRADALQQFYSMLRSGASQGIFFVMTAFTRSELPMKYQTFTRAISLQQNSRMDYADALSARVSNEWGGIREYPGRGMIAVEDKEAKETFLYEIQVAVHATVESDKARADEILEMGEKMSGMWKGRRPAGIPRIPNKPVLADLLATTEARGVEDSPFVMPLGWVKALGNVACVDTRHFYSGLFIGPKRSGRTTLLQNIALMMTRKGCEVYLVGSETMAEWGRKHQVISYVHGSPAFLEQFSRIRETINTRTALLTEAKNFGNERKKAVADSFKPVVLLIDDLDQFMASYAKEQGMLDFLKFFVRDDERVATYRVCTYATIQRKSISTNRMKEPLATMLGVNRAMMLQGATYECDPFKVATMVPGLKKVTELPRGEAFFIAEEGSAHVVLPNVEASADDSIDAGTR